MRLDEAKHDSRHDVSELREKYRGRQDIYVVFTDSGEIDFSGAIAGPDERPYGAMSWSVNDVISRANSRMGGRYANVIRYRPTNVLNERQYSMRDFEEDVEILRLLDYVETEEIDDGLKNGMVGNPFTKILDITNRLTFGHALNDRLWRRILSDLGYNAVLNKEGRMVILNVDDIQEIDIVQYETFRPENRASVIRQINRKNWITRAQRNRFSKVRELRQDLDYGEIERQIIRVMGK